MRRWFWVVVCLTILGAGCARQVTPTTTLLAPPPTVPAAPTPTPEVILDEPWWRTAVFYEIFVRSFYDSDGDGIGDFNGLTQKLDYLNDGNPETQTDLGITGIWLMPIHPSPSYHGYDVQNYYAVNSEYGTMTDFKQFLDEAHRRGIRVIIDLVLNHTSSQHPFFQDAKQSEEASYHDWYLWSTEPAGNGWHTIDVCWFAECSVKTASYYGYFCDCMPDLNYQNQDVTAQMEFVAKYWLENIGIDGFRIDAAKHLIENGNANTVNSPETHAWFKDFYTFYKDINPDGYSIGEVTGSDAKITAQYANGELDQIFNFEMASGFINSVNGESVSGIKSAVTFTLKDNPTWNFGTFLTNHDQNRVMSVLGGNVEKAKLAAFLLLTTPGTPFIYYGEEIGMTGQKPDEDIRRPMQWDGGMNAGFSNSKPWEDVHADSKQANIQDQIAQSDSLLGWYRRLIILRQGYPALATGMYTPINTSNRGVYAFLVSNPGEMLLVVANLTKANIMDYALEAPQTEVVDGIYTLTGLVSSQPGKDLTIQDGEFTGFKPLEILESYQGYIFSLTKQ